MKTSIKFLALLLSTLALSGCATRSCNKNTGGQDTASSYVPPAETVQAVAAPVVPAPVAEPVADEIPVATRKYVNK